MSDYIRRRTTGATYFFTLRLADRHSDLLTREVDQLRCAMRATMDRFEFRIEAITVLPAAVHMIWTLPKGDKAYPTRIAMLKSRFSRAMPMPAHRTMTQIKRAEKGIWQRRYWEHQITDEADFSRHRDMIYLSPVHAGLAPTPRDWVHTSLHRDLAEGYAGPAPLGCGAGAGDLHLTDQKRAPAPRSASSGLSLVEG